MEHHYHAVIFDVDGTLLDTTEGIVNSVKYTLEQQKLPMLSEQQLLSFIGPPIQESFRDNLGIEDIYQLQRLATIFRDRYKSVELLRAKAYEGIYQLCDELKDRNIQIAVATYKRQDYAIELLKHFKFDRYSCTLFGSDHENKLKKVDIIRKCIEDMKLQSKDYHDVVMVGDSWHDANGAKQIGIDFIGVTYGFGFKTKEEIMHYQCSVGSVNRPSDLLKFFA